jgi:predicted Zn finger-like uncharacterized protein
MFTVCPKCALTLVVTAADLRVAQGYVRCGRCSNVFNALSRLSEDRQAAAAAAQTQASPDATAASKNASTAQHRADTSGSFRPRESSGGTTSQARALQTPKPPAPAPANPRSATASPPPEPKRYDDDSIPEEDLEFNPDATDLNKVFVEQPPSPQFTAATGTFKAIRLEVEGSAPPRDQLTDTDERESPVDEQLDPTDTQVDVEIDPDLLATMAQLSSPAEPVNTTPPQPPRREAAAQKARPSEPVRAKAAPPSKQSVKHPLLLQPPPPEQPPQAPPSMRLAERAKARAEAARTGSETTRIPAPKADAKPKAEALESKPRIDSTLASAFETTQAIRAALTPRRRSSSSDVSSPPAEEVTSFFAGMWTAGSLVLLALLLVQIIHHYRHDLATNPTLNGPLTAIYAALGVPIVPRWDLTAYEVRQLGATTAGTGRIRVLASVKNTGHQAQPLPLLRVTLQDRFGNRIASRDVPPQSYLPRAIPSSSLLSAGQRIDAEMTFVDPGANAVGFEIDACLPSPGGGITCANDLAR